MIQACDDEGKRRMVRKPRTIYLIVNGSANKSANPANSMADAHLAGDADKKLETNNLSDPSVYQTEVVRP
jgi:hypothetical protein